MSAGLKELKGRIRGTRRVLQVTRALERAASVRVMKARAAVADALQYVERLARVTRMVARMGNAESALLKSGHPGAKAVIVLGSDKGLCGSFNTLLTERTLAFVAEGRPSAPAMLVVGAALRRNLAVSGVTPSWYAASPRPGQEDALVNDLAARALQGFLGGEYCAVNVLYNECVTGVRVQSVFLPLLPIAKDAAAGKAGGAGEAGDPSTLPIERFASYCLVEPGPAALFDQLAPANIVAGIRFALLASAAAEHVSRQATMLRATDNAERIVKELVGRYNRLRQEVITREVIETAMGGV